MLLSSFPRTPQSVIPAKAGIQGLCFSFFLDAGSGSGMTVESANRHSRERGNPESLLFLFPGCRIGVRHDVGGLESSFLRPVRRTRTCSFRPPRQCPSSLFPRRLPFVIPTRPSPSFPRKGIQGRCLFLFPGCRIESGMTVESANRHSRESGNPGSLPFPFSWMPDRSPA